ncbi:MAG: bacterial transcriptional activator domain-containing protein, partial [Gemmatimonadales bacterium]
MSSSRETHAGSSFRLLTLGGLSLVAPTGTVVRQQRRRLALLALVAAARDRGVSRDKLIAWLSPESTTDSARHSLHQLLYYLRQQAGENVFIGSDPLVLNPVIVSSDLMEFETAITAGSFERAVGLYKGPFLDGFHLTDSSEFDEWAAAERSRFATAFADALLRLAGEATERSDHAQSIKWWRQLADQDPLSGRAALGLMRSLAASGDAPAALVHARAHESLVRTELGSGPDPEVIALVADLQRAPRANSHVRDVSSSNIESDGTARDRHRIAQGKTATVRSTAGVTRCIRE